MRLRVRIVKGGITIAERIGEISNPQNPEPIRELMQGALEDARSAIPKGPLPDFTAEVEILPD